MSAPVSAAELAERDSDHSTTTVGNFRVVYDPKGDPTRPFAIERQDTPGTWTPEPTYEAGPARYEHRIYAENSAWNLDHFADICARGVEARPEK